MRQYYVNVIQILCQYLANKYVNISQDHKRLLQVQIKTREIRWIGKGLSSLNAHISRWNVRIPRILLDILQTAFFKISSDNARFELESTILVQFKQVKCAHFRCISHTFYKIKISVSGLSSRQASDKSN